MTALVVLQETLSQVLLNGLRYSREVAEALLNGSEERQGTFVTLIGHRGTEWHPFWIPGSKTVGYRMRKKKTLRNSE